MKRVVFVILLLTAALLAACSSAEEAAPTAEVVVPEAAPTQVAPQVLPTAPAEVPTEAPTEVPMPPADMGMLTGTTWQWVETQTPVEVITATDPARYQIVFNEDGSAAITNDCNAVVAQYTFDGSAISIIPGPTTLVACPEDSQSDVFLQQLSAAAIAFFEGDDLYIDLMADGGTMRFQPAAEPQLTGTMWQWIETQTPVELITAVDPARYQILFNEDGSANIINDCNAVIAQYSFDGSAISITPGPSTLVACPPDSQSDIFLQQLSAAAIAFFEGDDLLIDLFADGGTMRFSPLPEVDLTDAAPGEASGTVNAPDGIFLRTGPGTNFPAVGAAPLGESGRLIGVSADGQWYVAEAPALPGGQVWVSAQFVDATGTDGLPVVAAPAAPAAPGTLTGVTWQWQSLTTAAGTTTIADPTRYTITFNTDNTAFIQADCNTVRAETRTDGNSLTIFLGPSTLVACPPDTQDQLFLQSLQTVGNYTVNGNQLVLGNPVDGSTMTFVAAGSTGGGATDSPTGGAAGVTFRVVSFGPNGAVAPVVAGSEITATFDDVALTVSGSAGCNNYTGTLIPQGGFFTVGPIASTLRACDAPAGVMEQEAAFLAALGGTNGYLWEQGPGAGGTVVTAGQLFYTLADGTNGTINLVSP